jgi:hypothetical protein
MDLNGANAKDAMLWFLLREANRHMKDIADILKDIDALIAQGAILPSSPDMDTFIKVKGVDYSDREKDGGRK